MSTDLQPILVADTGMEITYGYTQSDEISLLFAKDAQVFGRRVRKLNSWCYWTLRKEGLSASRASKQLEGKGISFKNELLFQRGIKFNDLPVWQHRGVGIYLREYPKIGHNPITGEDIPTTRREVYADYDLSKGFVPL